MPQERCDSAPLPHGPELAFRLAKGIAGLLVVAKTSHGLALGADCVCCFRALVYGRLDTGGRRLPSSALSRAEPAGGDGPGEDSDGSDEDTPRVATPQADGGEAASAGPSERRLAALAQNRSDNETFGAQLSVRTVEVTRS